MYDKEHERFHDRHRKEALWAEIYADMKLQPFDVRMWFESQRTRYGKLSKLQSGQAPREMTKRQSWVYQQLGFLKTHIRCKGANRSSGFEASPNTSRHEESCGSTTDTEHLESSALRESASQPIITSTPVSTDSKILEHFIIIIIMYLYSAQYLHILEDSKRYLTNPTVQVQPQLTSN